MSRSERGAATVFAIAALGLLLVIGLAGVVTGSAVLAHRQAGSAADLAALAAAQAAQAGRPPCPEARRIARANRAELTRCTAQGWVVDVEVWVAGPMIAGAVLRLPARARAGPVGLG